LRTCLRKTRRHQVAFTFAIAGRYIILISVWQGSEVSSPNEGAPMPTDPEIDRAVLTRIRREYVEMPDLRLTGRQASRLWNLDQAACQAILNALIQDHFLSQTADGSYVLASEGRLFVSDRLRARHVD